MFYSLLRRLFPAAAAAPEPQRIVLLRPCCIGDVVMATAALSALRGAFPRAHISFAVGPWSAPAIERHPAIDELLLVPVDMPLRSALDMSRFIGQLRRGRYDMALSLVRSPLMSLAVHLSGIPYRAGLDSGGRGFGYNLRVPIDPAARVHESEIYLKVISAIAGHEVHAYANLPVSAAALGSVRARLAEEGVDAPFIVAHPGGGVNPGTRFEVKRFPLPQFAETLNRVAASRGAGVILLGGPDDGALVAEVERQLDVSSVSWVNRLTFQEIGALAAEALVYIGNDSGLTHLAAASGAKTVMLMGPTDPLRYAPYAPDSFAISIPGKKVTCYSATQPNPLEWHDIGKEVVLKVSQVIWSLGD